MTTSGFVARQSGDTPEDLIGRLVEELAEGVDGLDARPELMMLEDRLAQLREQTEAPQAAAVPAAPAVPQDLRLRPGADGRGPAAPGGRPAAADSVILEAARSGGVEPVYLGDKPVPRQRRAKPQRRRRSSMSFYLVAAMLLVFCYALFVLYKPTFEKFLIPADRQLASATATEPCGAVPGPSDPAGANAIVCARAAPLPAATTVPAATPAPVPAAFNPPPDPAPVVAQNSAGPELPIIYRNERRVKTYKVGADGKIIFNSAGN